MSEERIAGGGSPNPPANNRAERSGATEPEGAVAEALARVQEAVSDVTDGELRESLEAAIEVVDSARETPCGPEGDELAAVPTHWREYSTSWRKAKWLTSYR
jgi:hypothetical protein